MSFIRPEISAKFVQWRGALIGGVLVVAGLVLAVTSGGLNQIIGLFLLGVGIALAWDGAKRARFPAPGGGLGLVEVDERRITYLGPDGGNSVSIEDLIRVRIDTNDLGPFAADVFWSFTDITGETLVIPGDAEGVDKLFDALAALPGIDYEKVTAASMSAKPQAFVVWERGARLLQ
ncbi:MAG: hypothetical protein AAGP08_13985 [Pseudomonadota bacterium]